MSNGLSHLPGCFALHIPEPPDECSMCEVRAACDRVVLKSGADAFIRKLERASKAVGTPRG